MSGIKRTERSVTNGSNQRIVAAPHFAVRHASAAACRFEPHSHSTLTVTCLLAGEMTAFVGEETIRLTTHDAVFTDAGQTHSGEGANVEFVSVSISPVLVDELVTDLGLTRASSQIIFRQRTVRDPSLVSMMQSIGNEMSGSQTGQDAMLDAMVRQLVIMLLRSYLTVRKSALIEMSRAGVVDRRLRRAIEFMHDNFGRELGVEEIASAAYLSEYHFARLFKQITGVTPHVYLANLRLEKARRLLLETQLAISEIAATVGYQSQSHFTKMFRSVTGLTPRAYRDAVGIRR